MGSDAHNENGQKYEKVQEINSDFHSLRAMQYEKKAEL